MDITEVELNANLSLNHQIYFIMNFVQVLRVLLVLILMTLHIWLLYLKQPIQFQLCDIYSACLEMTLLLSSGLEKLGLFFPENLSLCTQKHVLTTHVRFVTLVIRI